MNNLFADIILFDNIGIPYNGDTLNKQGMGGSEFQAILLLEELAKLNKKVICLNNSNKECEIKNVLYLPHNYRYKFNFKCNHLIIHRNSSIPNNILHKKCYQWITDNNSYLNLEFFDILENNKCKLITLSKFSEDQFPNNWNKHIINFMIPDWVYNYEIPENKEHYIYASSLMKGYQSTLNHWAYLKNKTDILNGKNLNVCLPGYDNPSHDISDKTLNVNYLGSLAFEKVVELMAKSEGLFYINTMPETFCITAVLAEILKTTPHIFCLNGYGALQEVLNTKSVVRNFKDFIINITEQKKCESPNNYKSKIIIDKWLNIFDQ
jgi:hypothetical protein